MTVAVELEDSWAGKPLGGTDPLDKCGAKLLAGYRGHIDAVSQHIAISISRCRSGQAGLRTAPATVSQSGTKTRAIVLDKLPLPAFLHVKLEGTERASQAYGVVRGK